MQGDGAIIWIIGLPAAGKTTLARALKRAIGARATVLDGDALRQGPHADLGFDEDARAAQARRTSELALGLARHGQLSIVALVSPYAAARTEARRRSAAAGVPFVLVHIATPLETCQRRDPKGLYAAAAQGQLAGLTGVDGPFEVPADADITLSGAERVHEAADLVIQYLATARRPTLAAGPDLSPG